MMPADDAEIKSLAAVVEACEAERRHQDERHPMTTWRYLTIDLASLPQVSPGG
jgi:hypothetical protein